MRTFCLVFIILMGLSFTAYGEQFTDIGAPLTAGYTILAWGDYDGDGDLDLAAIGASDQIYRNDNGIFTAITISDPSSDRGISADWGDYDNDGDLDLLVTGRNPSSMELTGRIYRNDSGSFVNINPGIQGAYKWIDYDNDGDLDIYGVAGPQYAPRYTIYRNDSGQFTDDNVDIAGGPISLVAWGDYDNDGDIDAVASVGTSPNYVTRICRNDNGEFTVVDAGLAPVSGGAMAWGDFNNDGNLDLVMCGSPSVGRIYKNNGNGTFTDIAAALPSKAVSVAWGDYDSDGDLDLILAGMVSSGLGHTYVFRNDAGTFTDSGIRNLSGLMGGPLIWGDYDNDGDLDLALSGQTRGYPYYSNEYVTKIYRNDTTVHNTPPSAPAGLTATAANGSIAFSWNSATDSKTPQPGLSYNLRIGTQPGANNVMSGMAGSSGLRLLPATGNAQQIRSYSLKKLHGGTYYWSVQAIDAGLAGSSWAAERTITIPSISGYVKTIDDNPIQNATVLIDGIDSGIISNPDGYYAVGVMLGWSGTITLSKPMYRFDPPSRSYTNVTANQNNQNYTAYAWFKAAESLTPVYDSAAAWGDYDNDGKLDLIVTGATNESPNINPISAIYHNDGNGDFSLLTTGVVNLSSGSAAWGDYDNDGDLDLALCGLDSSSNPISKIYRNDSGDFVDADAGLTGISNGTLSWGDYDNDGDLDLLLSGISGGANIVKVYRNDRSCFTDIDCGLPENCCAYGDWADYDNDGDLDLIAAGESQAPRIYRNDNTWFTETSIVFISLDKAAWYDYDNDGYLDLACGGNSVVIYHNSAGSFSTILSMPQYNKCSIAWGDYDNDGDADLLVSASRPYPFSGETETILFRNDSGIFNETAQMLPEFGSGTVAFGDYDGDGDLDLVLTGLMADGTAIGSIYRNDGVTTPNSSPTAPSGLSSTVNIGHVLFHWNAATDSATSAAGLSYNLRVGASPGANDVCPGMADHASGWRRIPGVGNTQKNLFWPVSLPRGTYYWSVQAIDANFCGSSWADERSVTIDTRKISGYVRNLESIGVSNVLVSADNDGGSFRTSADGYYELWIAPGWSGTLTATKIDYEITPGSIAYENVQTDYLDQNFTANKMFVEEDLGLPVLTYGIGAWGDYDNDGDLDLAINGKIGTSSASYIYKNDNGVFQNIGANLVKYGSPEWGDYDNDGDLDLILKTTVYRNDNGVFTDIQASLSGYGNSEWGDYDNDGDLDLAIGPNIYRNDDGDFVDVGAGLTKYDGFVQWGDYDADGDLDITVVNESTNTYANASKIYRNDGGVFTDIGANLVNVNSARASWGDYDADGDLDLVISGKTGSVYVSKLYANNAGTFTETNVGLGPYYGNHAWGDYDNDGDFDVVVTGMIYRNDDDQFSDSNIGLTATYMSPKAWGDYDNDGDLDLLVQGKNRMFIWRNNRRVFNTVPSAPTGLSSAVDISQVTFNWDAATDSETQVSGLTYNLRVGTSPGGSDIYSSMADGQSGYRRIPRPGNAGSRLSWTLKIPGGIYYWSVQAIDTAFGASLWANEQTVTVDTQRITGYVKDRSNSAVPGMSVCTSDGIDSFVSRKNGFYELWVPTGWSGTVNIDKPGYEVDPVCRNYENVIEEHAGQDYIVWKTFSDTISGYTTWTSSAEKCGDYDNDGDLDIVVSGQASSSSTDCRTIILRNDGTGFTQVNAGLIGVKSAYQAWGDYDNDGDLDIVISGDTVTTVGRVTKIYKNQGGSFIDSGAILPPSVQSAWGDYDNDGDLDLAVCVMNSSGGSTTYIERIYRNDNGEFIDSGISIQGYPAVSWVDYDKDCHLDLAVGSSIYRINDGNLTLIASLPVGYTTAWADYDNDGDLDAATYYTSSGSRIYRNDGGTFTDTGAILTNASGWPIWGDYDNDGDLDLAFGAKVYRNDSGMFVMLDTGITSGVQAWGDLDSDSDLDLVTISNFYRNSGRVFNQIPNPPDGMVTSIFDNITVTLGWRHGADEETPVEGLSYNLRVGTGPTTGNICSGMASETGRRLLPTYGNMGSTLGWILTGLSDGIYYWSVQSTDSAFAGSAWSEPECFVIGNVNIAELKTLSINTLATVGPAIVTAVFQDSFYIESANRSVGIRIQKTSHGLTIGQKVFVTGYLIITPDGEACIVATTVVPCGTGVIKPMFVTNQALGGGCLGLQEAVWDFRWILGEDGHLTLKWLPEDGLNNIGLLVKVCGRVTQVDPEENYFYIYDGSVLCDGTKTNSSDNQGIRVDSQGVQVTPGQYVLITGISSCFKIGEENLRRILRVDRPEDIQILFDRQ